MAMQPDALDDLKKLMQKARQKPVNFGLCLGKKPEDNVLYLDLKKGSEVVMRKAKADGETGKITHGTAEVSGKILQLTIHGKMLPGLAKNMKQFMTKQDMKMKIVILDPSGATLEADGDEDDTAANQDPAQTQAIEVDALHEKWSKVSQAMTPALKAFLTSGHEKAPKVKDAWISASKAAQKGDYETALSIAKKVGPFLKSAPATSETNEKAPDPLAAQWAKISEAFDPRVAAATTHENGPTIVKAWTGAKDAAANGDFKGALNVAKKLKPHLDNLGAEPAPKQAETPASTEAVAASLKSWQATRSDLDKQMDQLISAIQTACSKDPALTEAAKRAPTLMEHISKAFDTRLEKSLKSIVSAKDDVSRDTLEKEANNAINDYREALKSNFFADVDSNGFTKVDITGAALKSLDEVSAALNA
ncbi:MAG: hypothetical protein MK098_02785 [Marinovum sp.]|nr:hypothetical protein [Marinovum sp.]